MAASAMDVVDEAAKIVAERRASAQPEQAATKRPKRTARRGVNALRDLVTDNGRTRDV
jgi:hypothetical protein